MKFILGKKIEMTQIWKGDKVYPVTKVNVGPCSVLQVKNTEKDGYEAVQLGYGEKKSKNVNKPLTGHFKKLGYFHSLKEFRFKRAALPEVKVGDVINANTFNIGDKLTVISYSKGKGFQGVVKRHGFHGQDATHGNKDQLRTSGSIGAGGVQRVFKGRKMGGRTGNDRVTLKDVEIVDIDLANSILFLKGAVAGHRNSLVMLSGEGDLKLAEANEETIIENIEEVKEEKIDAPVETKEEVENKEDIKEAEIKEEVKVEEASIENKVSSAEALVTEEEKKTE